MFRIYLESLECFLISFWVFIFTCCLFHELETCMVPTIFSCWLLISGNRDTRGHDGKRIEPHLCWAGSLPRPSLKQPLSIKSNTKGVSQKEGRRGLFWFSLFFKTALVSAKGLKLSVKGTSPTDLEAGRSRSQTSLPSPTCTFLYSFDFAFIEFHCFYPRREILGCTQVEWNGFTTMLPEYNLKTQKLS